MPSIRRIFGALSAFLAVIGAFFLLLYFFGFDKKISRNIADNIPKITETAKKIEKEFSLPPPLRVSKIVPVSVLTDAGIISQTNIQRKAEALPPLKEDLKLNRAAALKVADMFSRQYFAHVSPAGEKASDLAVRSGYQYLAVGENLALGNFSDDKDVVEAWMNSPGHRANILDKGFEEIGVAAERGVFEGEETWLAVQIFALPQSACPQPDENLKLAIDASEKRIDEFSKTAADIKAWLDAADPKTRKEADEYNAAVDEYNALVKSANKLIDEVKAMIAKYNEEVKALNECIAK